MLMSLGKHESFCSPSYGLIVEQAKFFNFSKATSLREEKLNSNQLYSAKEKKIDLVSHPASSNGVG